jgi:hypothetical protein
MKLNTSTFRLGEQAIIDIQPCKGNNLTTRHTWATKAPRVATVHNVIKESS